LNQNTEESLQLTERLANAPVKQLRKNSLNLLFFSTIQGRLPDLNILAGHGCSIFRNFGS